MATVFMKWLETSPERYERGIRILTLGRLPKIREQLLRDFVRSGMRVLEIGCGTGTLASSMAEQGASVVGIDSSQAMLDQARAEAAKRGQGDRVKLTYMDASLIGEHFKPGEFDLIVASLVFSEIPPSQQRFVLEACRGLLASDGRLVVVDEVLPAAWLPRLLLRLVRAPLALLTWLLTRATSSPLRYFDSMLQHAGFRARRAASYLAGSLILYQARPMAEGETAFQLPATVSGRLRRRITLRTLLLDLWGLFFRIIPPYPKVQPGLYAIGEPDPKSPVLVTGNFDLTVRRLVQALDRVVDVWLLVADSAGINVWCAAGGGYFTAEKVIAAVKVSRLEEVVQHRDLILPQLCANGVDGARVRKQTGWNIHWGPVRAEDIPAYLHSGRTKTDAMRWVQFPVKDRLEMVSVTMGFYGLMILLPVLIFWRSMFWQVAVSLIGLSYFLALVFPWLPGKDGLKKSVPLVLISLAGFAVYVVLRGGLPLPRIFNWVVGLTGLSVFVGGEMQGMSPQMRGEQANWGWEAVVGVCLGLIYWLVPMALGWR
ncbi:MAG: methyltransferase domain-containing protein [Anaerolineales bacterium]